MKRWRNSDIPETENRFVSTAPGSGRDLGRVSTPWGAIPETGIAKIDSQHSKLLAVQKMLVTAIRQGEGPRVVTAGWAELYNYLHTHFADEEAFMRSFGYPKMDEHHAIHVKFATRMSERFRKVRKSERDALDLLFAIEEWITDHVCREDLRYIEHWRAHPRSVAAQGPAVSALRLRAKTRTKK